MKYNIIRTDVADAQIRSIILCVAEKFGNEVALQKLNALEKGILALADNPDIGTEVYAVVAQRQDYLNIIRRLWDKSIIK